MELGGRFPVYQEFVFMRCFLVVLLAIPLSISAQKKHIPEGFEWVQKRNLLVSIREITCADWLEFLEAKGQDPSLLPTPNEIVSKCIYTQRQEEVALRERRSLFRDTSFIDSDNGKKIKAVEKCENMPVNGITYEQAMAYCDWLSDKYVDISKYAPLKLNFRLPTPAESDSLLQDVYSSMKKGDEHYLAFQQGINKHGCAIYNHRHNSWCAANILMKKEFGYGIPIQEGVFFPDMNGLLDLMGNVAEMTSAKGVAKGGSCIHTAAECQPGIENKYDGPKVWLGFRVVADLKK